MVDTRRDANYSSRMVELVKSATVNRWMRSLIDVGAAARVQVHLDSLGLPEALIDER